MRKVVDEHFDNLQNRNIFMADLMPLEKGNYRKTWINGIGITDINKTVKMIVKANSRINIYKVYYDNITKKLIFLADKDLNISSYNEKVVNSCQKSGKNSFAKYLTRAFEHCDDISVNESSLFEIKEIYTKMMKQFLNDKLLLKALLDMKLLINSNHRFGNILRFNYNSNIVTLIFDRKYKYSFKFNKDSIDFMGHEEFIYLESVLWEIYNFYKKYEAFNVSEIKDIKSTNTKFLFKANMLGFETFLVDLSNVELFKIKYDAMSNDFQLFMIDWSNKEFIENNYKDFLNYIYVSIKDLPIWIQKDLLNKRKAQLNMSKTNFMTGAISLIRKLKNYFN